MSDSTTTPSTNLSGNTIAFRKYEGLGNDFILIDDRDKTEPSLTPDQAAKLCHRNFGIGGDGVIFALQPSTNDEKKEYDLQMRIYNSDGSEPEMCGNGIRCLAQFIHDIEPDKAQESYRIETLAGLIVPKMNPTDNTITVDMGEPILQANKVPTTLTPNADHDSVVEQDITVSETGKTWKVSTVSMGNPHAIIFVNDLETDMELSIDGPALECHPAFPAKTNVEFVQVLAPDHLKMKVWERGAGPTLACGTGACALTVAAIRAGKIPRGPKPCRVTLPGGDLFIEWNKEDNKVYMTGPATFAFEGNARRP
jgi:diaminopimelate epimerase